MMMMMVMMVMIMIRTIPPNHHVNHHHHPTSCLPEETRRWRGVSALLRVPFRPNQFLRWFHHVHDHGQHVDADSNAGLVNTIILLLMMI